MFKKGQKVRLLVHGAGVTSEETATITKVTKTAVFDEDRQYDINGKSEVGFAGFWFELKPFATPILTTPAKVKVVNTKARFESRKAPAKITKRRAARA